ncbi:unnamed protein product [Miscanthus lutarioriparius]|uniref:Uncharacterized protein n=1 Tax=Miscanthus lutarioriparius TaxID=422564 RepID=A0A811RKM2_9POAL|nr:unnamed protein product [Miscanthus lutarioriparius]
MATPTDSASPPSTGGRAEDTRLVCGQGQALRLSHVAGGEGDKVTVHKDYTTGFVESVGARIFIHCLSTTSPLTDGHLNMGVKGNTYPFSQLLRYSILLAAVPQFAFGIS